DAARRSHRDGLGRCSGGGHRTGDSAPGHRRAPLDRTRSGDRRGLLDPRARRGGPPARARRGPVVVPAGEDQPVRRRPRGGEDRRRPARPGLAAMWSPAETVLFAIGILIYGYWAYQMSIAVNGFRDQPTAPTTAPFI